ncbi:TetR/AcrR family transcriptional regulator [Nocardioides mangrovi]|uniref:TetR/AcrR family transcriptional regulator n=1 Tax=Nocardioides mangrovi TaxID=2874580 RepID=A0ABS7U9P3_9ACTN|nr:TetR/AcrR family transcriptional regulator [Nocardioides mangrovi]MBZ5737671.1 TetR/AcrR family transcriptional regulator [Nocardioides mangrovi]
MAKGEVRARMVTTAVRLLAEKGPTGASFGDVLEAAGAPRGSTYHHFPAGKREMYDAALDLASQRADAALEGVRGQPADVVVETFFGMWRSLLTHTELRAGCAVLAVAVAGDDAANVEHAGEIFAAWRGRLESLLVEGGLDVGRARTVAAVSISAAEGAVALARAEQSLDAFELVAAELVELARRAG